MTKDEAEIRSIIADHARAHHDKNVDLLLAHGGEGFLSFDLAPPLQNKGGSSRSAARDRSLVRNLERPDRLGRARSGGDGWRQHRLLHVSDAHDRRQDGRPAGCHCGSAPRTAFARKTANGRSCTCIARCLSTWTAARGPVSTSSPDVDTAQSSGDPYIRRHAVAYLSGRSWRTPPAGFVRPRQPILVARPPDPTGCTRSSTTDAESSPGGSASASGCGPVMARISPTGCRGSRRPFATCPPRAP